MKIKISHVAMVASESTLSKSLSCSNHAGIDGTFSATSSVDDQLNTMKSPFKLFNAMFRVTFNLLQPLFTLHGI